MSYTWAEPFAGAAATALRLVGGRGLVPPCAWMGSKRRYAREIADAMGVPLGAPGRVLLADAGPWGWVWPLLLEPESSRAVCAVLRSWQGEHPRELWERLASQPPAKDPRERAAQWLWLQARSASGVPVWWSAWRLDHPCNNSRWKPGGAGGAWAWVPDAGVSPTWRQGDGSETGLGKVGDKRALGAWEQGSGEARPPQPVGQRGAGQCGTSRGRTGGMVNPATIAERVESICAAFAGCACHVHHGDAAELAPVPGFALVDPPYVGCTGYGWDMLREAVLELARRWAEAGAVVAVCEAEPLPLDGWHHVELTRPGGKPEWLTLSRVPKRLPERLAQRGLWPT